MPSRPSSSDNAGHSISDVPRDRHLPRNTLWMLLSFGYRLGVQAAFFIIVARTLGRTEFGTFAGAVALVTFLAPFATLGTGNLLIKQVTLDPASFAARWGIVLRVTAVSGAALTAVAAIASSLLFRGAVSIPFILMVCAADLISARLVDVAGQAFQAFGRLSYTAAFQAVLGTLRLAGAIAALGLGFLGSAERWGAAYMLSSIAAAAVCVATVRAKLGPASHKVRFSEIRQGAYFAASLAAQNAYNDIDKTMLVRLSTLGAAGIYAAAYRLIDAAFAPVRALVYAAYSSFFKHGADGLARSSSYAVRLMVPASAYAAVASLTLFWAAPALPRLLGADFGEAASALRWLALLPLIKTIHYFGQDALTGANHQGFRTLSQVGVAVFNVAINLWLIPGHGWRGAAWASIASEGLLAVSIWTSIAFLKASRTADVAAAPQTVSLVVATRNRPVELRRLVESLANQGDAKIQLVVVDQSGAETRRLNAESLRRAPGGANVLHVWQDGTGLSRARNLGLALAKGEIVAFPDDDCRYPPLLLRRVKDWFAHNPADAILAGIYGEEGKPHPRFPLSERRLSVSNVPRRVSSVGLFLRREVIEREAGFREDLGAGTELACGEEVDFVCRILRRGHRGRSVPSFQVHHAIERATTTGDEALSRIRANAFVALGNAMASPWLLPRIAGSLGVRVARSVYSKSQRQTLTWQLRGYRQALRGGLRVQSWSASLEEN